VGHKCRRCHQTCLFAETHVALSGFVRIDTDINSEYVEDKKLTLLPL
jgi:hypothetical protein